MYFQQQVMDRLRHQEQPQDDAWLNDVGPRTLSNIQEQAGSEAEELVETVSLDEEATLSDETLPITPRQADTIGPDHPLQAMMLRLSSLIWSELRASLNNPACSESLLIDSVRRRAIELLRGEPAASRLIQEIDDANLLLCGIVNEVLGYGPLQVWLEDPAVSAIIVAGPSCAYVERNNRVEEVSCRFADDQHMQRIIGNLVRRAGLHMQPDWSIVDAYLPDGSLFTITLPPNTINGPTITIHKHMKKQLVMTDLVTGGSMSQQMANFLLACVRARLNIVICGAAGCGKTTLLNALCMCIPTRDHIVTIEDIAELSLDRKQRIALLSGCKGPGATERIGLRGLLQHASRMRPERLIVGECRGGEAAELLQTMLGGQEGVMTTMYAQGMRDCLARLEMLCLAGCTGAPADLLRAQLARSLDVIVHLSRQQKGHHAVYRINSIAEVLRADENDIKFRTIFHYQEEDEAAGNGKATFIASGFAPTFLERFQAMGVPMPREMFIPRSTLPGLSAAISKAAS